MKLNKIPIIITILTLIISGSINAQSVAPPSAGGVSSCAPATLTLSASSFWAVKQTWYTSPTGTANIGTFNVDDVGLVKYTAYFSSSTAYYVSAIDANGNESTRITITVTIGGSGCGGSCPVSATPAGQIHQICSSDLGTFTFTASSGSNYQWKEKIGSWYMNIPGAVYRTFTPTRAGFYRVEVGTSCGQKLLPYDLQLMVTNTPVAQIVSPAENPVTACSINNSINLTSSYGQNYQWKRNGTEIPGANYRTYHPTQSGYYSVVLHGGCGTDESSTKTINIINPTQLTVNISGPSTITECKEATYTATVGAGLGNSVNYQWYVNNLAKGTNGIFSSNNLNNGDDIKCTITLNNSSLCVSPTQATSNTISVMITDLPKPYTTYASSSCGAKTIRLHAQSFDGAEKMIWYTNSYDDDNAGTIDVDDIGHCFYEDYFESSVTYYVAAILGECESPREPLNVTINYPATPAVRAHNSSNGASLGTIFTACENTASNFYFECGSGDSFQWLKGEISGNYQEIDGEDSNIFHPTETAFYKVVVQRSCGGEWTSPGMQFTILSLPNINIIANPSTTVDPLEHIQLTASGAGTYQWSPNNYLNIAEGNNVTCIPEESITYTVTGTSNNCASTKNINVIVNMSVEIQRNGNNLAAIANGGKKPYTYEWSNGSTSSQILAPNYGTSCTVTVTDALGVQVSDTKVVDFQNIELLNYIYTRTLRT